MTDEQLTALQTIIGKLTRENAITLRQEYILSVAVCELHEQMKANPENITKQYGTRFVEILHEWKP